MAEDGFRADWAQKDFYATLGVKKDATAEDIKKAYRKLARANHPDSNPGDSADSRAKHDKFKAVAEAYDVVGDPAKRKKYDEMRSLYGSGGAGGFGGGFGGGGGGAGSTSRTCSATAPAVVPAAPASATCSATSSAVVGASRRDRGRPRAPTPRRPRRSASSTPSRA